MKARHGRYADTAENRRLHRVGQEYGHAGQEEHGGEKKPGKGEEAKEKRTYETARKELSAVLSHKEEFISKYGEDEYNKRVGSLVAEAKQLSDDEHKAAADKDFDKLKEPEKPKDTRSKKEKRTERLAKYKEQLKKVQEKMNQEGESEESRKMGEALEAKWKAKIEKLEAKVNRGKKKETPSEALANDIKEYTTKTSWLPREGTAIHFSDVVNSKGEKGELRIDLSGDSWEDGYDIKFGENFTAHAKDQAEAYAILEEFKAKDMPDVEVVEKKEPEKKESEKKEEKIDLQKLPLGNGVHYEMSEIRENLPLTKKIRNQISKEYSELVKWEKEKIDALEKDFFVDEGDGKVHHNPKYGKKSFNQVKDEWRASDEHQNRVNALVEKMIPYVHELGFDKIGAYGMGINQDKKERGYHFGSGKFGWTPPYWDVVKEMRKLNFE